VSEDEAGQPATEEAPVFPIKRKRRGGVIGAAMMGLEQALYGPRQNEIVVVADADGMPEPDFDIDLTPDPRHSTVRFRRLWWHKRT
jgi:cellulose synthase/poly-beta-1,6-N-acetylglucosamine synthase-like glycosyltransferase